MNINDKIVAEIMNDGDFENELKDYLNEIIDGEIQKGDDMDDELVHDCIEALVALESSSVEEAVEKLRSSKNIVKFVHRKSFVAQARRKRIAAAIAVILIAHTASYMTIPAYASAVSRFFGDVISFMTEDSTEDNPEVVSVRLASYEQPDFTIHDESEIDLDIFILLADYQDGRKDVEVSKDKYIIVGPNYSTDENGNKEITYKFSYGGKEIGVTYTLEE